MWTELLNAALEAFNRVTARLWGNQTQAQADTERSAEELGRDYTAALLRGDTQHANDLHRQLVELYDRTAAKSK